MTQTRIEVSHLNKTFGQQLILKDISFKVVPGEKVVLIGPSGSGKSTLLRCLNRLESPTTGKVAFDGQDISQLEGPKLWQLRQQIGMVFQQFNLFPNKTVLENITFAPRQLKKVPTEAANEQALALLQQVGLADKANTYPQMLSGGQQQRVAIARALAMKPKLMLFDEPTSALDPEMVAEVLQVMKQLADAGMTMVIVTHEMGFAEQVADQVLFLADGELLDQGGPDQVFHHSQNQRTRSFIKQLS